MLIPQLTCKPGDGINSSSGKVVVGVLSFNARNKDFSFLWQDYDVEVLASVSYPVPV